jgi:hypothetical protein
MKDRCLRIALVAVFAGFGLWAVSGAEAGDKQTLTGELSDSTCSTQHMRPGPAECTRFCVAHGGKYMLIVGDKFYSLNTSDKALLSTLDKQAGQRVTVTGEVNGVGVDVATVVAAK